jgi:hypothetical protein
MLQSPMTFLLNAGWAWAAVPVFAGALQQSKLLAALAGPFAGAAAVFGYYLSDSALGGTPFTAYVYEVTFWLVGYVVVGSAFALIGFAARSNTLAGLFAKSFVPTGAFIEMIFLPRWPVVDPGPDLHIAQAIVWVAAVLAVVGFTLWYLTARRQRLKDQRQNPVMPSN